METTTRTATDYRVYLDGGDGLTDDAAAELTAAGLNEDDIFREHTSPDDAMRAADQLLSVFPDSLVTVALYVTQEVSAVVPRVDQFVRFKEDVERPHFLVPRGMVGQIALVSERDTQIDIRMAVVTPGAEEWDNEVCFSDADLDSLTSIWDVVEPISRDEYAEQVDRFRHAAAKIWAPADEPA